MDIEEVYRTNQQLLERLSVITTENVFENEKAMYSLCCDVINWSHELWVHLGLHPEVKRDQKIQNFLSESSLYLDKLALYFSRYINKLDELVLDRDQYEWKDHMFKNNKERSSIEALLELYRGTDVDNYSSIFDTSELDDNLEIMSSLGYVDPRDIPDSIPDTHWWWWPEKGRPPE